MSEGKFGTPEPAGQRIVVLGGFGFMGSHICRALVARGHSVRIFDKLYASHSLIEGIEQQVEIVEGDASRPDDVLNAIGDADVLINLVHTTVPGSSMNDPGYDITSNVVGAAQWLQSLAQTKVRRILYFSSGGTVYGIPQAIPIDENHPTNPASSYGITKLAIEKYVSMYASLYGCDYCLLRPSNVYGPGQRLQIGQGVIGVLADRALRGEPLNIWGTGETQRDYLYVDDLVEATLALLSYTGPYKLFNVSSGKGHSVLDIIAVLRRQLRSLPEVVFTRGRDFDVPANVLDSSRLAGETGWRPSTSLETGIARTIEALKKTTIGR